MHSCIVHYKEHHVRQPVLSQTYNCNCLYKLKITYFAPNCGCTYSFNFELAPKISLIFVIQHIFYTTIQVNNHVCIYNFQCCMTLFHPLLHPTYPYQILTHYARAPHIIRNIHQYTKTFDMYSNPLIDYSILIYQGEGN